MARQYGYHRWVGVSAATGPVSPDAGLGYVAGDRPETTLRSPHLRALALLEGIRDRGRRRPAGALNQRHDVHVGHQRATAAGVRGRRDPALEGRSQYARRARRPLLLRRAAGVHAAESGAGDAGDLSLPAL